MLSKIMSRIITSKQTSQASEMDANPRNVQEAMDSLRQIRRHVNWISLALIRAEFYLNSALNEEKSKGKGKGQHKGKGKENVGDGKGQGKGYGKGGSHYLRSIAIAPTLPQEPPFKQGGSWDHQLCNPPPSDR